MWPLAALENLKLPRISGYRPRLPIANFFVGVNRTISHPI